MQQIGSLEARMPRNCTHCTEEDYQICKSNLENCPRLIRLPEGICGTAYENYIEKYIRGWKFPSLIFKPKKIFPKPS